MTAPNRKRSTDEQLLEWANHRADGAGRLARELIELRARNAKLETAIRDLVERLDEVADAIKPPRERRRSLATKSARTKSHNLSA